MDRVKGLELVWDWTTVPFQVPDLLRCKRVVGGPSINMEEAVVGLCVCVCTAFFLLAV